MQKEEGQNSTSLRGHVDPCGPGGTVLLALFLEKEARYDSVLDNAFYLCEDIAVAGEMGVVGPGKEEDNSVDYQSL